MALETPGMCDLSLKIAHDTFCSAPVLTAILDAGLPVSCQDPFLLFIVIGLLLSCAVHMLTCQCSALVNMCVHIAASQRHSYVLRLAQLY
jgi:hypothetical protein